MGPILQGASSRSYIHILGLVLCRDEIDARTFTAAVAGGQHHWVCAQASSRGYVDEMSDGHVSAAIL